MLSHFKALSWQTALSLFFVENLVVILLAIGFGKLIQLLFRTRRMSESTLKGVSRQEIQITFVTLVINTFVTHLGFLLWRHGIIHISEEFSYQILVDFAVLFVGMDFLMYVFHYIIHKTFLYQFIHQLHHRYPAPQPIDLFVLHPAETVGFGSLWLVLMIVYPASFIAIFAYLSLNVFFGILGHSGVEPYPTSWANKPVLKYIGSSTFHFQHHQDEQHNFGFYTSIWDRLFGTLSH